MKFIEYLSRLLTPGHEAEATLRSALLKRSAIGDSWMDSETALGKYRRRRAIRTSMAKASRRRNRGGMA